MGLFDHIQSEIENREKREGITPADLLDLPPKLRHLMNRITRQGEMTKDDAAEILEETPEQASQRLDALVEKGYLQRREEDGEWIYQTRFAHTRGRDIPVGIWSALGNRANDEPETLEDSEESEE